jgi:site-specific DNA recombinase
MVGSMIGTYPTYACTANSLLTPGRCSRHIAAQTLEAYVQEYAVQKLSTLDAAILLSQGPSTKGAIRGRQHMEPDATRVWQRLAPRRKAVALRQLFQKIKIGPKTTPRPVFDYSRIHFIDAAPDRAIDACVATSGDTTVIHDL